MAESWRETLLEEYCEASGEWEDADMMKIRDSIVQTRRATSVLPPLHNSGSLPAAGFKPSRDQRQAINRWSKFVLGEDYPKEVARRYPKSKDDKKKHRQEFDLVETVHEAEVQYLKPVEASHKFEVSLEPDTLTDEKFELFKNYQMNVHKEGPSEVTKPGFRRFLCDSPLVRRTQTANGKEKLLGSYHQCYRLDGRLIAIGVLDLLPHAVSGVYFIYHKDFERWSFGKISALREATLALEGQYDYYYMGYYIHACVKMRYKGDYKPQYVLDPMTYEWHAMEKMVPLLNENKFVSPGIHSKARDDDVAMSDESVEGSEEDEDSFTGPDGRLWRFKTAAEAGMSGQNVLSMAMPGVPNPEQLLEEVDLDELVICMGPGMYLQTKQLRTWDEDVDVTHSTLRGAIAEMAACLGLEAVETMAIDFGR